MEESGQGGRRPPEAMTLAGSSGPTRQSQASGSGTQSALRLIMLAALGHMLRTRRFYELVAFGAIVLAALAGINQESRANTFARLAAWNKRQAQLLERQVEREGKRLARKA
jgi:hypothetical protein